MIKIVLSVLTVLTLWFVVEFVKDFWANRENLETHNSWVTVAILGAVTNFLDALGIGSFAIITAISRAFKLIDDRLLPGTLNVSCTLPIFAQALIYMTVIKVETITLLTMLASSMIGAWCAAGYVAKLPKKKVQLTMGIALFVTAMLMFAAQMEWFPGGGDAVALSGVKLVVAIVGNFILGALMTAGIGLYAPCMALVYFLGMNPKAAFPIMMGSCAFLMPAASVKFVKEQAYEKRASMGIALGGIVGVLIAAFWVKELDVKKLKWIVIVAILYTSMTMIKSAISKTESKNEI